MMKGECVAAQRKASEIVRKPLHQGRHDMQSVFVMNNGRLVEPSKNLRI